MTGQWEIPWCITSEIRKTEDLIKGREVVVEHTFKERNQLLDFLANYVLIFVGTDNYSFLNFQQLPGGAKVILNMDKSQVPNLRKKNLEN